MATKPKADYDSKLGPIPPEHFDNDPPFKEVDTSKGSLYDAVNEHIKNRKPPPSEKKK